MTLVISRKNGRIEKWRDLTQSYDKSPYTNRNVKRAKWQHKQRHKKVRLNSGCRPTSDGQVGVTTAIQLGVIKFSPLLHNFFFHELGVTMVVLVFYKTWQGIGESPVKNQFNREA